MGLNFVHWRCLRTSHATWLKMAGADVKDAQAQMRHSRPSTTLDIYYQQLLSTVRTCSAAASGRPIERSVEDDPLNGTKLESAILQVIGMMVARDGVEPPTPAFSGLRSTT
jgi:hypothetical protein